MDIATVFAPWTEIVRAQIPDLELFDAHTHLGQNDPDGMRQTPPELLAVLDQAGARGAFVFPMHEPDGYPPANDMVLEVARETDGDRLVPFCRVNPHDGALVEAERCLDAGARGIKLHPRAEQFTLDHPQVRSLAALAHERRLPILVHAGRGIPALGEHAVQLAGAFPEARMILAHAGICDLSWLWHVAPEHPNLLFDTAWWMPADLLTLFSLVPPGQILFASDAPYGAPAGSAAFQLRAALQAGLSPEQIRCIGAEQSLRIAAGEPLQSCGPPVGEREQAPHILLDRVSAFLMLGAIATMRGNEAGPEMLALARLSCDVPDEIDDAPVFAAIRGLLDAFDALAAADPADRRRLGPLILAAAAAKSPDVPVPAVAAAA
ncbi:MAG TPA: amidohydrolase family protein [Solirubrobacteraceae bacterium]|jgi:predicted TIM-barrel fold metal-dependent hydrolase|nr:amidohydrolase family protein [Solirubrobacteraceae bacterium]